MLYEKRSSIGDKLKDTTPCEKKKIKSKTKKKATHVQSKYDPRTNIHRNVTGERLSGLFYSVTPLSPSSVLFQSIDVMSIATSINLNRKISSMKYYNENISLLLRKLCYTEKRIRNTEKNNGAVRL